MLSSCREEEAEWTTVLGKNHNKSRSFADMVHDRHHASQILTVATAIPINTSPPRRSDRPRGSVFQRISFPRQSVFERPSGTESSLHSLGGQAPPRDFRQKKMLFFSIFKFQTNPSLAANLTTIFLRAF
jgi:hypothetical protein